MNLEKHHGGWVIVLSFIVSLMLAIMPLPIWASIWRPDWAAMVLIYWCIATPQRIGITTGWFVGLVLDVLYDTLLGLHALTLSVIGFMSVKWHQQVRLFPIWQQALFVFTLIIISQLLKLGIQVLLMNSPIGWSFIYPALTSMCLWPWIFIILRDMRRIYQVF